MNDPNKPATAQDDAEMARQKGADVEYDAEDQEALEQDKAAPAQAEPKAS